MHSYVSKATDLFLLDVMQKLIAMSKKRSNKLIQKLPVVVVSDVKKELEEIEQRERIEQYRRETEENRRISTDPKVISLDFLTS